MANQFFPTNYWERPPRAAKGSANSVEVHAAVGAALSQWETVETLVSALFALVSGAPNSRAAQRAYGTIGGVRGRCDALRAAGDIFFNEIHKDAVGWESFNELLHNYQKASERRNDIAHGVAITEMRGAFLAPPTYATKKIKLIPPQTDSVEAWAYAYSADDITALRAKFTELTKVVVDYQTALFYHYGLDKAP